jgi:hypothetical protein
LSAQKPHFRQRNQHGNGLLRYRRSGFQFQGSDVIEHLKDPLNDFDDEETAKLLKMICTDSEEPIKIPEEQELFGYVAVDLLERGKGAVTCRACNKAYDACQLKSVALGAGKSPFDVNLKPAPGLRNLSPHGKRRNPSMVGGQGYECPEGHRLIAIVTWRT